MTLRIVFRRAAKSEFEDAAVRYDEQRLGLGEEFTIEIEQAVARAADAPERYPIVFGDVRRTVARRFPFSVYFRVRSDALVVLAVFHGRRNPAIWQRRVL
jgi:plasmid stabilization system protein ParE